jgi:hypothetical protein
MEYDREIVAALRRMTGRAKLCAATGIDTRPDREAAELAVCGLALVADLVAIGLNPREVIDGARLAWSQQWPKLREVGAWESELDALIEPRPGLETLEGEL